MGVVHVFEGNGILPLVWVRIMSVRVFMTSRITLKSFNINSIGYLVPFQKLWFLKARKPTLIFCEVNIPNGKCNASDWDNFFLFCFYIVLNIPPKSCDLCLGPKSLEISPAVGDFFGTEIEILADCTGPKFGQHRKGLYNTAKGGYQIAPHGRWCFITFKTC